MWGRVLSAPSQEAQRFHSITTLPFSTQIEHAEREIALDHPIGGHRVIITWIGTAEAANRVEPGMGAQLEAINPPLLYV